MRRVSRTPIVTPLWARYDRSKPGTYLRRKAAICFICRRACPSAIVRSHTLAEWQARRQMKQIAAFLRKYVPGFERSYLAQSGVTIGVRETRRITGDYQLTADDILGAR